MKLKPLRPDIVEYVFAHQLEAKWEKAKTLFVASMRHPSLHTELLEPKWRGLYSFRVDRKYRALFFVAGDVAEVVAITNHYKK